MKFISSGKFLAAGIGFTFAIGMVLERTVFSQGSLDPAGAPAPLFKTLDQVQPGQPIPSLDPASPFFGPGPYTISGSGYYYLTQNLAQTANSDFITISGDDVTLDLRGFKVAYTGSNPGGNLATGIRINNALGTIPRNIEVRNGIIKGSWKSGIEATAGRNLRFEDLRVDGPRNYGIVMELNFTLGTGSQGVIVRNCQFYGAGTQMTNAALASRQGASTLIENCTVQEVAGDGIVLHPASESPAMGRIINCTVHEAGGEGIAVNVNSPQGVVITGCTVSQCGDDGIQVQGSGTFKDCHLSNNANYGIRSVSPSIAESCVVERNGSGGILFGSHSIVRGCSAYANAGNGITTSDNSIVAQSVASYNTSDGISVTRGGKVVHCSANWNGQPTSANGNVTNANADGIVISSSGQVHDCNIYNNEGVGIRATSSFNMIFKNAISSNDSGGIDLTSTSNSVFGNYVTGNNNFQIDLSGGDIAPIQNGSTATHPTPNIQ